MPDRQSKLGVIAFACALLCLIAVIAGMLAEAGSLGPRFQAVYESDKALWFASALLIALVLGLLAFGLGAASLFQRDRKKTLGAIGLAISMLLLVVAGGIVFAPQYFKGETSTLWVIKGYVLGSMRTPAPSGKLYCDPIGPASITSRDVSIRSQDAVGDGKPETATVILTGSGKSQAVDLRATAEGATFHAGSRPGVLFTPPPPDGAYDGARLGLRSYLDGKRQESVGGIKLWLYDNQAQYPGSMYAYWESTLPFDAVEVGISLAGSEAGVETFQLHEICSDGGFR